MPCPRLTEIIKKKRKGEALSSDDIAYFIEHLQPSKSNPSQEFADPSQIGSLLMAIYLHGMNDEETQALTRSMKVSGFVFSWPKEWKHLVVDKHSTGGVGDKVSLILAPALAAVGLKVPMISGRSLSHTGGTLDKLESIPGYCVEQSVDAIIKQIDEVGCCIVGQTEDINPADRIIYHTRDITATVEQPSLITASIVSKKLAEGLSGLVYDVKFGRGSMFESEQQALEMAKRLVLASSQETKCCALFTAMNSPIGYEIGNSVEVLESVRCLKGHGPEDLDELVEELGAELMYMTGVESSRDEGRTKIKQVLKNEEALQKFHDMMIYQGVSKQTAHTLCYGDAPSVLPKANISTDVIYEGAPGFVCDIDSSILANFWRQLMNTPTGPDLAAGLSLQKHVGDGIKPGDAWMKIQYNGNELETGEIKSLNNALLVKNSKDGATRKRVHKRVYYVMDKLEILDEPL